MILFPSNFIFGAQQPKKIVNHIYHPSFIPPYMPENISSNEDTEQSLLGIKIILVTDWPTDEIVTLYKEGGWWRENYDPSGIPSLIKGSFAFSIAKEEATGRAIGMGRVISDGISDAYIQDVVVLNSWRGKGIGKRIVKFLLNHCKEKGLLWIGLVAEPGTKDFYTPLGFKVLPGEPMVFRPGDSDA
jgi:GNAT superfamily N-acetyltransferase